MNYGDHRKFDLKITPFFFHNLELAYHFIQFQSTLPSITLTLSSLLWKKKKKKKKKEEDGVH